VDELISGRSIALSARKASFMIKISVYLGSLVFLFSMACRVPRTMALLPVGNWQANPVVVDGNDEEWPQQLMYQDKKEKFSYSITNDANNLYICLKTSSDPLEIKILQSGLTIWFDYNGQKKETMALRFPLGNSGGIRSPDIGKMADDAETAALKREGLARLTDYALVGFETLDGSYDYRRINKTGVKVAIGLTKRQELVYEAAIPLDVIYRRTSKDITGGAKNIAVEFYSEGLPTPPLPSGMSGAPSGGGTTSGPPLGGGVEEMTEMQNMFNNTKVWKVLPLASDPSRP
jgi:hypothetical protein